MNGFKFAGITAGIKKKDVLDLGLIYCDRPCTAAALFTKNQVVAAPVILGRQKIQKGTCQAVLVNSGNANCFTGAQGMSDAIESSQLLATALNISEEQVQVSSTGVIGAPLPMDKMTKGISRLPDALESGTINEFADAILTTDTCRKVVERTFSIDDQTITITGIAKGSGMIRPDMATMLAFICTDAGITSENLHTCLTKANEKSFNRISVDGDTSTNDTVLAMASGAAGVSLEHSTQLEQFTDELEQVCLKLAKKIVRDGEGATKLVKISVHGAVTEKDAYAACEAIAHSNLVKTAIYGQDPNWGRITAAAGRSGAQVDPELMDLHIEGEALVQKGMWLGKEAEIKIAQLMKNDALHIELNLNLGAYSDFYYFCDFSETYVRINADYRT